jgi:hypothetical protein
MDPKTALPQVENKLPVSSEKPSVPVETSPVQTPASPQVADSPVTSVDPALQASGVPDSSGPQLPPSEPAKDVSSKKSSPIFIIALIFLLVVILALGGYVLWTKYLAKPTATPTPIVTPHTLPTSVPVELPSASPSASPINTPTATSSGSPTASPSAAH